MSDLEIKGASFLSMMATLGDVLGSDALTEIVAALPAEASQRVQTKTLLPGSWYPVAWYRPILAGARRFDVDDARLVEIGRRATLRDITTLYRAVFRVLSTQLLVQQTHRLCQLFFRGDFKVTVLEVRDGFGRVDYAGFQGLERNMWLDLIGGAEAALSLTGAQDVRIQIESGGDGPGMRATVHWR